MAIFSKIWFATIGRFIGYLNASSEDKFRRESLNGPIMRQRFETLIYYEGGRSTLISSAFAPRTTNLDLLVYRDGPLKWFETGELLTPEETERVYSKLPGLLAANKIRWAYSEMIHKRSPS